MFQKHLYCCWLIEDFAENNAIAVILGNNEPFHSFKWSTWGFICILFSHQIMQQKFNAVCFSVIEMTILEDRYPQLIHRCVFTDLRGHMPE